MTSAFTAFDASKPAATQTGSTFAASANANDVANWYAIVHGGAAPGFVMSKSGGTTEEPTYYLFTNGAQIVRAHNYWTSGYLTRQVWEVSQDTGATYAQMCDENFSYDGTTGALTATTGGGGMLSVLYYLIGRLKAAATSLTSHIAATVSGGAHNAGSLAAQNADAVAITGGSVSCTYEREAVVAKGNIAGSTAINWAAGGRQTLTVTNSAAALTWTNLPNGVIGYLSLEVTNGGIATSLLTALKPGGTALSWTNPGKDIVTLSCRDGSTVIVEGFARDVK